MEEQPAPVTLRRLNKIRAVIHEHLGYAPEGVLPRDAAIV